MDSVVCALLLLNSNSIPILPGLNFFCQADIVTITNLCYISLNLEGAAAKLKYFLEGGFGQLINSP